MDSASSDNNRPQFGNRFLKDDDDVFDHNAWDDVEWDEEQESMAKSVVEKNSCVKVPEKDIEKFETEADALWNAFYEKHQNRFFKDRHWLFTEFPELGLNEDFAKNDDSSLPNEKKRIFELGCGVGNTIIPILKFGRQENLMVYGCDFSDNAVEILRTNPEFDASRSNVFVMDISEKEWNVPFEENSIDIIVLIFVLSAIHPDKMKTIVENSYRYLKPGGMVLLRDYGRYDMAQLRFKPGKCLQENFYVRGDGTRVYFFTQNELESLFKNVGFIKEQCHVDRRLQVNRARMLKMYRVWIQCKYKKPV